MVDHNSHDFQVDKQRVVESSNVFSKDWYEVIPGVPVVNSTYFSLASTGPAVFYR
jgi:hypothetical protein